jgi:hypothetical protein
MTLVTVSQRPWRFTLYKNQDDGFYILSVLCGTVGMFELNLPLSPAEADSAAADPDWLARRAAEVAGDPDRFAPQSIKIVKPPAP